MCCDFPQKFPQILKISHERRSRRLRLFPSLEGTLYDPGSPLKTYQWEEEAMWRMFKSDLRTPFYTPEFVLICYTDEAVCYKAFPSFQA